MLWVCYSYICQRVTFWCFACSFEFFHISFLPCYHCWTFIVLWSCLSLCSPVFAACVLVLLTLAVLVIIACKLRKRKGTVSIFISISTVWDQNNDFGCWVKCCQHFRFRLTSLVIGIISYVKWWPQVMFFHFVPPEGLQSFPSQMPTRYAFKFVLYTMRNSMFKAIILMLIYCQTSRMEKADHR